MPLGYPKRGLSRLFELDFFRLLESVDTDEHIPGELFQFQESLLSHFEAPGIVDCGAQPV